MTNTKTTRVLHGLKYLKYMLSQFLNHMVFKRYIIDFIMICVKYTFKIYVILVQKHV